MGYGGVVWWMLEAIGCDPSIVQPLDLRETVLRISASSKQPLPYLFMQVGDGAGLTEGLQRKILLSFQHCQVMPFVAL